jgi:arylsulfatase A-like enzyme
MKQNKPPNILFIHVDQLHWEAMSGAGNRFVQTPNIDRIMAEGVSFRRAYSTMPQCCPARASWYTGRMSSENGVVANGVPILPEIPDLGQWLTRHSHYQVAYAGKWHVSGRELAGSFQVITEGSPFGEVTDGAVARAGIGFLEKYQGSDPFFLNVGFLNPHDCCFAAGSGGGLGKYGLADELLDQLPPLPENFVNQRNRKAKMVWTPEQWRYYRYVYYRLVEMVDAEIGRIYQALRSSRFADNTLIIFSADHGDGLGFHGKLSKGFMEEEAWHVPLTLVFPGRIPAGVHDDTHLVSGVDIPATICDYAEIPPLPKMTIGKSLRKIAEGTADTAWREYVVGESFVGPGEVAVRDRQYKTIFYSNGSKKVYDLGADPLEMNDLSATERGETAGIRHRDHLLDYLQSIELNERVLPGPKGAFQKTCNDFYSRIKSGV